MSALINPVKKSLVLQGYSIRESSWYNDGLYTSFKTNSTILRPKPNNKPFPLMWEPRWFFFKPYNLCNLNITAAVSDDGGDPYIVLELAASLHYNCKFNPRAKFRGPRPQFVIHDILLEDIQGLPEMEKGLCDALVKSM